MLWPISVGAAMALVTVCIHALGTDWWIRYLKPVHAKVKEELTNWLALRLIWSTALWLLMLHTVEVMVWSCVYVSLDNLVEVTNFEEAMYFSTVTFATLGYGDLVIYNQWRMLAAIQSMTGMLVFGWSAALLYAVVQRIWGWSVPAEKATVEKATVENPTGS